VQHRRIIKQGPVSLATREDGSMDPSGPSSQGLFLGDTRFLSTFQVRLNDVDLVLVGSSEEILFEASYLQTNQALSDIPPRGIGILQHNTIEEGAVRIAVTLANWAVKPVAVELSVEVDSDFYDSFEARGVKRLKRGQLKEPVCTADTLRLEYVGLDNITRVTEINVNPPMARFTDRRLYFPIKLEVAERKMVTLEIKLIEKAGDDVMRLQPEPEIAKQPKPQWFDEGSTMQTSNNTVNTILQRSLNDLEVLLIEFPGCWVPAAGLPRFGVPFGRDCLLTGLETLLWNPTMSRDILRFLAKTQGKEENPWNYEQPGKIMHEMHTGELARLNEIPFGRFYGSVDSTPLFLAVGAEYIRWTGDLDLYHELKPHFDAAWKWIDHYGNIDGSGYIQYQAHTPPKMSTAALTVGLFNQGWKDSANSVVYSNGQIVTDHPISLSEVQGYLYRALSLWSDIYEAMPESEGHPESTREEAERLRRRAATLKEQFNREFWMPDKQYYAMALDGHHRHVDIITSNPGHCLWSRIVDEEHAEDMARTLMGESMLTAWGIRTMAYTERAFNPFSYHDGSVWPFDNALIASGLKKYGFVIETQRVLDALIDASHSFEYQRWPEVYCGVSRMAGGVLARQPDASRPQAFSTGAIFFLLQTVLGIAPRPFSRRVDITPALPASINEIVIDHLPIAGGHLGLRMLREGNAVLMEIKDNPNEFDIIVHPAVRNHGHLGADAPAVSR